MSRQASLIQVNSNTKSWIKKYSIKEKQQYMSQNKFLQMSPLCYLNSAFLWHLFMLIYQKCLSFTLGYAIKYKKISNFFMILHYDFSSQQISHFMSQALTQAEKAASLDEVPVGCIFVNEQRTVVARSHNMTNQFKNASYHCQINCINLLEKEGFKINTLTLFVTVEPCIMCTYALNLVGIHRVYFGQFNDRFGGCGSVMRANTFPYVGGIKQKQSLNILKNFYERGNQKIPQQMRNKSRKRVKKEKGEEKEEIKEEALDQKNELNI